jgi:hypothetical protein
MTRESLKSNLSSEYFEILSKKRIANWQGDDCVSLSCNPNNKKYISNYSVKDLDSSGNDIDDAYKSFILNYISLIIDKDVLKDVSLSDEKPRMNYEILIKGDIPIKYIKAIGIPHDEFIKKLYLCKKIIYERLNNEKGKYFYKYYQSTSNVRYELSEYEIDKIINNHNKIKIAVEELLKSKNIDLPIIDIMYGYQIMEDAEMKKELQKTKKLYNKYLDLYNFR